MLTEVNNRLVDALASQFSRKPYLLSDLLVQIPVWPCGHDPEDLLFLCRLRLAEQKNRTGYMAVSYRAADKCLTRMLNLEDESAELRAERRYGR